MRKNLFLNTTKQERLRKAWRKVFLNGIQSKSSDTREEIEAFQRNSEKSIRDIQRGLRSGAFRFAPAKGVKIPKKTPGDFRPLVVSPIETRIVQRAVLDQLLELRFLKNYIETPYSFGGIGRREGQDFAAVPAAIKAVLDAKAAGLEFVYCADISAFFTNIRKSQVREVIISGISDDKFIELYDNCVNVELSNMSRLRDDAKRFPIGNIGVAQGNALSPLLGNILLKDFDEEMNSGDCRCFRYIDDIIILAPNAKAARARFRRAAEILINNYGMQFSEPKSSAGVQNFRDGFSYLGIELVNGLIRPDGDAINRIESKIRAIVDNSIRRMSEIEKPFTKPDSLIYTLVRISGTVGGWSKHYRFCNDTRLYDNIDHFVDEEIARILGYYQKIRHDKPSLKRKLLGVAEASTEATDPVTPPFVWPK